MAAVVMAAVMATAAVATVVATLEMALAEILEIWGVVIQVIAPKGMEPVVVTIPDLEDLEDLTITGEEVMAMTPAGAGAVNLLEALEATPFGGPHSV